MDDGDEIIEYLVYLATQSIEHNAICEMAMYYLRRFGNCGDLVKPSVDKFSVNSTDIEDKLKLKYYLYKELIFNRDIEIHNKDCEWSLSGGNGKTLVILDHHI